MNTIFDLRSVYSEDLIQNIQHLYEEECTVIQLGNEDIHQCIGCWSCWLKTPGMCVMKDPMASHYKDYMNSGHVIILMDTAKGFINHVAKAFLDRSIPHYLPYIILRDRECQHEKRYLTYPNLVFYFDRSDLTKEEEQVIEDYLYRTAYQHKSNGFRLIDDGQLACKDLYPREAKNKQLDMDSFTENGPLIIYNGSPRKTKSNSGIILAQVKEQLGDSVEIRDLKDRNAWSLWVKQFPNEKHICIFMPLYVHAMPSHVMEFIEQLDASNGSLSFFVQSGFPESSQSYYVEAYFELLTKRMGRNYGGTAIKGGMEGLQMRPVSGQTHMIQPLVDAIAYLEKHHKFEEKQLKKLARPLRSGLLMRLIFHLVGKRMLNWFWNRKLKSNNAYEKALDKPYISVD